MAETTATLQAKLKALTGGKVDILIDEDTFKSTTQILREMSAVWEEMTDMEQAAALELIGGKRQANILSSLISNFETVEDVIKTSTDSQGSAMIEQEKWLDSIEGKTHQLTNSMQAMWNNAVSSDVIKRFLDLGIAITKVVDGIGLLPSALAATFVYFTAFKKNNPVAIFTELQVRLQNYNNAVQQLNTLKGLNVGMASFDTTAINAYAAAVGNLSAKQQVAVLASQGLNKEQIRQVLTANQLTSENIELALSENAVVTAKSQNNAVTGLSILASANKNDIALSESATNFLLSKSIEEVTKDTLAEAVSLGIVTNEEREMILQSMALTAANTTQAFSWKALGTAITTAFKSNPVGWILTIISSVAMLTPMLDGLFKSTEQNLQDLKQEWQDLEDKITTASNNFKTLKSSADEVIPRFAELAKGVNKFGDNVSLTEAEYTEFLSLNNKLAEMFPEINNGMDENGNAMLSLSLTANTLEESLWALVEAEAEVANQEIADTMPDVLSNIKDTTSAYKESIKEIKEGKEDLEEAYNLYLSGEGYKFSTSVDPKLNETIKNLDKLGIEYELNTTGKISGGIVPSVEYEVDFITDEETVKRNYENLIAGVDKEIQNINDRISSKWAQLNPIVTAWTQTNYTYQGLSDEMQNVVQAMLGNIDFEAEGLNTQEEVENYINNNILSVIDGLSYTAQNKFSKLMSIDTSNISVQEYKDEIEGLAQELADMNIGLSFDEIMTLTGYEDVLNDYESTIKKIMNELDVDSQKWKDNLYSLNPDEITKVFDLVKKYGLTTWKEISEALENETFTFTLDYDAESKGLENLNTAIEESLSATGLSAESIENIKARYQELDSYDPARLFEETTHGIRLNTDALNELEQEYEHYNKQATDNKLENLVERYNELTDEIESCTDASERASLYVDRQNILDEINDTATLAARYEGLTSAYNKWQQTKSGGNDRDMYSEIISGREEMDDEMSRGWIDDGTRSYLGLLSGKDLSTASYEKVLEIYQKLNKEIGAGYNIYDFFTEDEDGNETTDGIYNFFDTVMAKQKEVGENWVKVNKDGEYILDFGEGGDKAVAEALGISEEIVQIILKAAEDAGFEINLDSTYSNLADFKDKAEEVNDRLKEIGATDYTFNINSTDINDLDTQIDEAKDALQNLKNEDGKLKVGVDEEDYENAQTLLATLIYQKQSLDEAVVLKVNVEDPKDGIETIVSKLQEFKSSYNELEVKTAIGADTTEAKQNVDNAIAALQQEDHKILADLGVDLTGTSEEINTAINNITVEDLTVKCKLDKTLIDGYVAEEKTTNGTVVWDNNITKVTEWMQKKHEVDGTVEWGNDTTDVKTHFTATGKIKWSGSDDVNGTAHASGTAHAGGNWGAKKTETALTGELGPELIVRGNRWFTVGDNGAEFTNIQKGDIIFNHKQTEELLKNGYVTSRGKMQGGSAHAQGTAFSNAKGPGRHTVYYYYDEGIKTRKTSKTNKNKNNSKDSKDEFEEVFDWFEVKLEELNEDLDLFTAKLENATSLKTKNSYLDDIISTNKSELKALEKGQKLYEEYAETLYYKIPKKYRQEAKDGKIAIEEFYGETDEKTLEAIKNYREWTQKAADLKVQMQEVKKAISDAAKQKIDNIEELYQNRIDVYDNARQDRVQNYIDLQEAQGKRVSSKSYNKLISEEKQEQNRLKEQRKEMQKSLDASVKSGKIKRGDSNWWEAIKAIQDVDNKIDQTKINIQEWQNDIDDLKWDNFDKLIDRLDTVQDELNNIIDLMGEVGKPVITPDTEGGWGAEDVQWSGEGLMSIGLHAANMETSQIEAKKIQNEIDALKANKDNYIKEHGEDKYNERMKELTSNQYDQIKSYNNSKQAIVDLNKARVDAIKDGIQKEIEAQEELIEKKKEELNAQKNLYDFNKKVTDQKKSISEIDRQLAALAGDNSASARAQRKKLEAEKAQAQQELKDSYYDRSVEKQNETLDAELEIFKEGKEKEIELLDKYLEDTEKVVKDSFAAFLANQETANSALLDLQSKFGLKFSDAVQNMFNSNKPLVDGYDDFNKDKTDGSSATEQTGKDITNEEKNQVNQANDDAKDENKEIDETNEDITAQGYRGENNSGNPLKGVQVTAKKGTKIYNKDGSKVTSKLDKDKTYTAGKTDSKTGLTTLLNSKRKVVGYAKASDLKEKFKKGMTINADGAQLYDSATDKEGKYQGLETYKVLDVSKDGKRVKAKSTKKNDKGKYITGWFDASQVTITKLEETKKKNDGNKNKNSGNNNKNNTKAAPKKGDTVKVDKNAKNYGSKSNNLAIPSFVKGGTYTVMQTSGSGDKMQILIGKKGTPTGWVKLKDLQGYAKGSKSIDKDQLALLDELGEELQIVPNGNGRLDYVKKGTGIIPADMTERLMNLAMNPQDMLDRNRPTVGVSPEVHNTEINLNIQYGDMLKIENFKGDNPDEIAKIVAKQFEKHTKDLNSALRKYVR